MPHVTCRPFPVPRLRMPLQLLSRLGSAAYRRQLRSLQDAAEWPGSQTGLAFVQRTNRGNQIHFTAEVAHLGKGQGVREK